MQTATIERPVLRMPRRVMAVASAPVSDMVEPESALMDVCASIDSMSLLRGGKSVQIAHNGSLYKLQATKLGKLILTK